MRLILLGPPGCGKGTQAELLSQRHRLEHIGTGDLLREAIRLRTPMGNRAHPYVAAGKLVPDDLVNDLMAERFRRADRPERYVMDGYPRTLAQAVSFDQVLRQQHLDPTGVVLFHVPDEEIVRRAVGRWSCPKAGCKATYNTDSKPPKKARTCDLCGTALIQREDDHEDTVRARLQVYHKNTIELVPYYRTRGLLREIQGTGTIEEVYANLMRALGPQAG